jgi:hypothetical protein
MTQEVRLWEITEGDTLKEINQSKLNLEERIESWLENDISVLSKELLVIGRQVVTDFGGIIDILCLDADGDVVIVELKRDKTPREITAQTLDYATWVKDLSNEKVIEIGNLYFSNKTTVEEAFRNKFGEDYPEVINESHKMLIVASEIDSSSERIIKYLSDSYGVGINAVTFNYFRSDDGKEFLSRVFLIEPSEVDYKTRTKGSSKKSKPLTFEELQEIADQNGVSNIYKKAVEGLYPKFDRITRHPTALSFKGYMGESKSLLTIINLYPPRSNHELGLLVYIHADRMASYFNLDKKILLNCLQPFVKRHKGLEVADVGDIYFKCENDIDNLLSAIS